MSNSEPLISVIVPVYNGQEYLAKCIASIEEQTYKNLEIIIINDGSSDDTGRVCKELQDAYSNVYIINLNDEGVSAARNAGIDMAHGEFVTFVDADDLLLPEMLEILYECLICTDSDIVGCGFFIWRNEAEWRRVWDERKIYVQSRSFDSNEYLREAVLQGNSRCWSKLYRREVIGEIRFQEKLTIGEDMLFLVSLLPYAKKISETQYAGYGYFQNPGGTMNRAFTPRYMDQITCWEIAREKILAMDQSLDAQVTAILVMGIMLTVGKIALLPGNERNVNKQYVDICHKKLKEVLQINAVYKRLSLGYKIKTKLFQIWPALYLRLYNLQKSTLRK